MLFNSAGFLCFFPIVVLIYYLIPHRFRYLWILVSSLFFYLSWNVVYGLILVGVIVSTFLAAAVLEGRKQAGRKLAVIISIIVCLGILCVFKYSGFIMQNLGHMVNMRERILRKMI